MPIVDETFLERFECIFNMGLSAGIRNTNFTENDYSDSKKVKTFFAACHRGYEKSQNAIFQEICKIRDRNENEELDFYKELILRKIVDTIAYTLIRLKTHVSRRLWLHDRPRKIDLKTTRSNLEFANKLNHQDRMAFSVVSDLTTFIHLGDLLKVNCSHEPREITIIELKDGEVNGRLLSELSEFEPTPETIADQERVLPYTGKELIQAKRILRQKARLKNFKTILATDHGYGADFKCKVRLSQDEIKTTNYSYVLDELLDDLSGNMTAGAVIDKCILLGAGYDDDHFKAQEKSRKSAVHVFLNFQKSANSKLNEIRTQLLKTVSMNEQVKLFDLFNCNIFGITSTPFPFWGLKIQDILKLVSGKIALHIGFDLAGFCLMAETLGFKWGFSTRREAAEAVQRHGRGAVPLWGHRMLRLEKDQKSLLVFSGLLSRFINDLTTPSRFLEDFFSQIRS